MGNPREKYGFPTGSEPVARRLDAGARAVRPRVFVQDSRPPTNTYKRTSDATLRRDYLSKAPPTLRVEVDESLVVEGDERDCGSDDMTALLIAVRQQPTKMELRNPSAFQVRQNTYAFSILMK